jgi:hypothetical protein
LHNSPAGYQPDVFIIISGKTPTGNITIYQFMKGKRKAMLPKRSDISILAILILFSVIQACSGMSKTSLEPYAGEQLFLQNNIHAQQGRLDNKASYANWTNPGSGHFILPVNSAVEFGRYRKGLTIKNLTDGRSIYFEYSQKNMGMSAGQYVELIASSQKVNLNSLSGIDQRGIKEGKAYPGMTKKGVRIALGYPASHKTPSLYASTWIYWQNRFNSMAVEFGKNGKVTKIRN